MEIGTPEDGARRAVPPRSSRHRSADLLSSGLASPLAQADLQCLERQDLYWTHTTTQQSLSSLSPGTKWGHGIHSRLGLVVSGHSAAASQRE